MPAAPTEQPPARGEDLAPVLVLAPARIPRATRARRSWPVDGMGLSALAIAGILCFVTFYAKGGLNLESMTTTEIALTLAAGLIGAGALLVGTPGRPLYGLGTLGLLIAFAGMTTLSVVWSVQPDSSWHDAGRMLAYSGVFAAAVAIARLAPQRWPALLGGLVLAAVVVCGYALATKVFPAGLAPSNAYARLEEPFGYWNAIGLAAAMGAMCCMWLGSRRSGHAVLSALAYPAMGLLLLTLTLAYSRGALAAFAVGLVAWFCIVPLRLRGAAVLLIGAIGAGSVAAWDFSTYALSSEKVPLAERVTAGHQLGAFTLAMLAALTLIGIAIGFAISRRAPALLTRRRAGAVILAAIVLAAIAFAGALAHSQRGFSGSISHAFDALTNPNAKPPSNTPDRLTAVASVRARYWKEALQVFKAHPLLGSGAEGYATAHLRYRTETLSVRHAHGFVVQTLADLGLLGLLLALALLIAWSVAAGRATHPFNRRWVLAIPWRGSPARGPLGWQRLHERELRRYPPERIALLTMLCVVIVFGMHSLIDWTWYVPGNACVALICAGWLAGRGPLRDAPGAVTASYARPATARRSQRRGHAPGQWSDWRGRIGPLRGGLALIAILAALLGAWSEWQPQRSEASRQEALDLLAANRAAASDAANRAVAQDPLSVEALFTLADVQSVAGDLAAARTTLQKAVKLQPSNPKSWLELGRFDLLQSRPQPALSELRAAIYLNPESIAPEEISGPGTQREAVEIYNDYIEALRGTNAARAKAQTLKNAHARRAPKAGRALRGARPRPAPTGARNRSPRSSG